MLEGVYWRIYNIISSIVSLVFISVQLVRLDNLALYLNSHDKIGALPTSADWVVSIIVEIVINCRH